MKETIQMVDLKSQYLRIKPEIDKALLGVAESTAYINGPPVKDFAENLQRYNEVRRVVTCANGTDALQIAMMALNFKPGDEVIVPAFTYVATVEVISLLGLIPRFIDVREDTFALDEDQLENFINEKTVGIVPVHLFGQCANMEKIDSIAKKHNLVVIEDAAQAIGAVCTFKNGMRGFAGTLGDIGTTSFFPSKNLGCFGDGGALFTQNNDLGSKIHCIANHGQKKRYYHERIGVNSRLDSIQAAILDVKLRYLNDYIKARQEVAKRYDEALASLQYLIIPQRVTYSTHVYNQYTCRIVNGRRDELRTWLAERDIPTMIYYPVPLHLQEAYQVYGYNKGDFPIAESLSNEVVSFPIHTEMKSEIQGYIIDHIKKFFN